MRGTRSGRTSTSGTLIVDKNHPIWQGTNGNGTFKVNTGSGVYLIDSTYTTSGTTLQITPTIFSGTNLRYQFYVDNDLEETNPVVVADDDQTAFWSDGNATTLAEETTTKIKGTNSLKLTFGDNAWSWIYHLYGSAQNWSSYEFICLYIYGNNTGKTIRFYAGCDSGQWTWTSFYYYSITENFTGWKRIVLPKTSFSSNNGGSESWSTIWKLRIGSANENRNGEIIYIDRIVVDTGQWVKIETGVPDTMVSSSTGLSRVFTYASNGTSFGSWHRRFNNSWVYDYPYFLNGQTTNTIYGTVIGLGTIYQVGDRGETKNNDADGGGGTPTTITYISGNGCRAVGFSVKLPPDDMTTVGSGTISKMLIKFEFLGNNDRFKTTMV